MDDLAVADALIERLALRPHPEGGWFGETWRGDLGPDGRSIGTSILFLLRPGERSHWHRIDATEIWHHHAGGRLRLSTSSGAGQVDESVIGDAAVGNAPTAIVPPHVWQAAEPVEGWALVACTVTPGFEFDGFELAPAGWTP